ncbi:MAG: hypothetical protein CBC28_00020 [Flavobacteriaceae bacterium TMED68]|nr:MAG: hypothetical protein CBC28_00020 [Flavobacteriaceae bacterium TMED68]|tara:strand:+ start:165 stop:1268 length:1104 start_codon:yes stop_codon:yes gene_type:complete
MKKLKYITYQTFPSIKANSIQTIENLNHLRKYFDVELIFPLRESYSSDKTEIIKNYYDLDKNIRFLGTNHKLPFGKVKIFEKYLFLISHYLWAKKICKKYEGIDKNYYFTRSDWVFYFLSKYNKNVIFECHQLSKLRKWIMKESIKCEFSKIIFLNKYLLEDSGLNIDEKNKKVKILHNGVDKNIFKIKDSSTNKKIIFSGSFSRFNEDRNLDFLLNAFKSSELSDYQLEIIGGSTKEVDDLRNKVDKLKIKNVKISNRVSRKNLAKKLQEFEFGILLNSNKNTHSVKYTSPLKFFEFISVGLKVIAIDFPAHRVLPNQDNIFFFMEDNKNDFINAIKLAEKTKFKDISLQNISLEERTKEIYNLFG